MLYELEHLTNFSFIGYIGQWMDLRCTRIGSKHLIRFTSYLVLRLCYLCICIRIVQKLQLNDMCPIPPLHVQWIHHHSKWVSNWANLYQYRIADWNARVAQNRK
ncbi:hypothetical protein M9H77_25220 [Catharanthus roseus]|uniref:Uncharacterized protein n=1 Tax=Catharanthus roseus TaxID=4058 RepID=A0ACC0A6A1_CATRO|nr:hypothetical protein M9H77_25220 [Catharanthus roseus]